ncbi:MAG: ABC transporter ATP-binding protein, partial [Mycobacteriales bacterium]
SLLSNANSDVEATWWVIAPFPMAVGTVLMIGIAGVALLLTDWVLAIVGFCVFPAVVTVNVLYSRKVSPRVTRAQQLRAELSAVAHESFDGALVVKTLGKEDAETARFAAAAGELRDTLISVGRARGTFDPLMEALPNLGTLAVLAVGAVRLGEGAVSVQDVVSVSFLFSIMAFPIRAIGWVLGELPRSVVGWDRLRNVLTATGEMPYGDRTLPATAAPAELTVEKLSFTYAPPVTDDGPYEPQPALRDVDFQVRPGRTVAVVGPTGAGKSTLAGLMVRLVDPDSGAVTLDGVDLRELAAGELPAHIALVPQTTFLFDDTVRGNVTLGADVSDERVWQALRLAQADRFVRALPDGLDTKVGERGTTLSGGQRQRLALARALVRRPRLLVLDDATSSVDSRVEAAILRGLREADLASTVVVVAYRQATIALADEIVYLEHGAVVARGSHAELLEAAPGYAELVHAYAEAEEERRRERAALAADAAAAADADADDDDEEVVA